MRFLYKKITVTLIVAIAVIYNFKSPNQITAQTTEDLDINPLVQASNKFMLKLYSNLKENKTNILFSPYSVSSALAICYFGAEGDTEVQMRDVLGFKIDREQIPIVKERLYPLMANLQNKIDALHDYSGFDLNMTNSLWAQNGYKFLNKFIEFSNKFHLGSFYIVDFLNNGEEACNKINSWVNEHTRNRTAQLLPIGVLSPASRLVLINTIYFDAEWLYPFRPNYTKQDAFWISEKQSIEVPMMHQKNNFRYMENVHLKIVELPYVDSRVSMLIIIPTGRGDLQDIEDRLNKESLILWLGELTEKNVSLSVPKFKISSELDLVYSLSAIGINDAFNPDNANFSGLDGSRQLYLSSVIHKSFIDVDEFKTEAASSTAVVITKAAEYDAPVEFLADRPFIFLIRHNDTGLILFIGRVLTPA